MARPGPVLFGKGAPPVFPRVEPRVSHEEIAKATEAFLESGGRIERMRASGAWQCYPIELWREDYEEKRHGRPLV